MVGSGNKPGPGFGSGSSPAPLLGNTTCAGACAAWVAAAAGSTGRDVVCAATPTTPGMGVSMELPPEFDAAAVGSAWAVAIGAVEEAVTAVSAVACWGAWDADAGTCADDGWWAEPVEVVINV